MLQYDPNNPKSPHAKALSKTALLIGDSPAFWALSETNVSTADEKIIVGVHERPWEGDEFTIQELHERFCEAQVYPEMPSQDVVIYDGSEAKPLSGGVLRVDVRRIARATEVATSEKRQNLFLAFYDHIAWLLMFMVEQANIDGCPRLQEVQPMVMAAFNSRDEQSAQGEYLFSKFRLVWGDAGEE